MCHRILQREMGLNKKGEVIQQRVRDDNIHENRTQYKLHTNSGHSTSLITLVKLLYISDKRISVPLQYQVRVFSSQSTCTQRNGETTSHQLTQTRYTIDTPVCVCVCVCVHVGGGGNGGPKAGNSSS